MSKDDVIGCGMLVFFSALIGSAVFTIGWVHSERYHRHRWRAEAIESGVAEYRVDAKTGEVSFEWRTEHE